MTRLVYTTIPHFTADDAEVDFKAKHRERLDKHGMRTGDLHKQHIIITSSFVLYTSDFGIEFEKNLKTTFL